MDESLRLSFSVRTEDRSWTVDAQPVGAAEAVDLLTAAAGPQVVITDLATASFLNADFSQWDASEIAADRGIEGCTVHRLGSWASGTVTLGPELLVLEHTALPRLLDGTWSPYQLGILDVPAVPTADGLDEIALTVGTAAYDRPVLPALGGSQMYATSHDDRYLTVETTDPLLPAALVARLLALVAGGVLVEAAQADLPALAAARTAIGRPDPGSAAVAWPESGTGVVVPEPPAALVAELMERGPHWYGTATARGDSGVTVLLTALDRPWRLDSPRPERPDLLAEYHPGTSTWTMTGSPEVVQR